MKMLIFGISGLTGYKLAKLASTKYDVYGTYNTREITIENCKSFKIDIVDDNQVAKLISDIKPDFTVNTIALHNVDYCEENKEKSFLVNTKSVKSLRDNCDKNDSKLLHISTDYVFDGHKKTPYKETDKTIPVSVYGESKLDGEKILYNTNHIILRPSVIFGWTPMELAGTTSSSGKPMNFAMWLLTKLHQKQELKIITDQFATATLADSLAKSAIELIEQNASGIYHISGLSCESRYDFAIKFAKNFGFDNKLISPVSSSEFAQKAKRPAYSCLDCNKAITEFGLKLLPTGEALHIMKTQVEKEAPHLLLN